MSEHLHGHTAELIPELHEWREGKGISLADWTNSVGRYDHAVAYASIFWPDLFLRDDCVFRLDPETQNYAAWMPSYLSYTKERESFFSIGRDLASRLTASENRGHWLYEVEESPLLRDFMQRNPHVDPHRDVKHYLVFASSDVIDVISAEEPIVSARTDSVRGWIRPGEKRSAPPGWDGTQQSDDPF